MANQSHGVITPVVFSFNSLSIRAVTDEQGNPWFVARDICKILGYQKCGQTVGDNCRQDGVSSRYLIDRLGRRQETLLINEGNLYRLIIKSKKPEAEKFERLVMEEILPAIRKTGSYSHTQKALPAQAPKRYSYPRKLLEQAYFITPNTSARLDLSMLISRNFSSPLMSLLADLDTDGHDVTAPRDELIALREALVEANETLEDMWKLALEAQHRPSSVSLGKKNAAGGKK